MNRLLIFLILLSFNAFADIRVPEDTEVLIFKDRARDSHIKLQDEITFLVWNIYKGEKDNFSRVFTEVVKEQDFVLMQEANYDIPFEVILGELFNFEFSMSQSFLNDNIGTGVALLSRFRSHEVDWIRSQAREPFIKTPKMFQLNTVPIAGMKEKLLVVNIHGINFVRNRGFNSQVNQLKEAIKDHQGPIFLGGDFNTWNQKRMNYLKKITEQINLKRVVFENAKVLKSFLGNTLDHVFIRGMKLLKARADKLKDASDHAGMFLKLKISK